MKRGKISVSEVHVGREPTPAEPCLSQSDARAITNRLIQLTDRAKHQAATHNDKQGERSKFNGQAEGFSTALSIIDEFCARRGIANY